MVRQEIKAWKWIRHIKYYDFHHVRKINNNKRTSKIKRFQYHVTYYFVYTRHLNSTVLRTTLAQTSYSDSCRHVSTDELPTHSNSWSIYGIDGSGKSSQFHGISCDRGIHLGLEMIVHMTSLHICKPVNQRI